MQLICQFENITVNIEKVLTLYIIKGIKVISPYHYSSICKYMIVLTNNLKLKTAGDNVITMAVG